MTFSTRIDLKLLSILFSSAICLEMHASLDKNIQFDNSMRHCPEYDIEYSQTNEEWCFLRQLYNNYLSVFQATHEYTIPKLIHLIWLGSPLPQRCEKIVNSWKRFHPDWTVTVWTDSDVDSFKIENKTAFDKAQNYGEKSDIWRYEILHRYGGLYVDTDFECLKSFDELHCSNCEFYTGTNRTTTAGLLIGIIGAKAGHSILRACIDNLQSGAGAGNHSWERILNDTGPDYFTRIFFKVAPSCPFATIVSFPVSFFYAFPATERSQPNVTFLAKKFLKPESMAVHYWATSWQ